jgi:hypothetical protein
MVITDKSQLSDFVALKLWGIILPMAQMATIGRI